MFVSLGSAAENIEAAVDYLRETRGAKVGSIHPNVFRPFPEAAIVKALAGKKNVIILERTDEPLAGDNPMGRDIRTALNKALMGEAGIPKITFDQMPRLIAGVYGLGSRDFRPEHTIGAYEFAIGQRKRKDGKGVEDGVRFIALGIDHPYEVKSDDAPSLLPEGNIAVRFHSVGGWGAITTGKNLGAIIGDLNDLLYERDKVVDEFGNPKEIIHVSANPKYGSEKKGAPTAYFMVAAPERIRVNCDLRHANVVLCCDPKAFTHCNPLDGMQEGGCLVWESEEEGEQAWERLPLWARQQIIEKKIRVFTLPGFEIARKATDRGDLQLRMQGNAFLGAFFSVSPLLQEFGITQEQFHEVVHKQYVKKFGRLGEGGREVQHGSHDAGLQPRARDPRRRAQRRRSIDDARKGAAACRGRRPQRQRMRFGLPIASRPRRAGRAHAADANRRVRQSVPQGSSVTTSRRTRTSSLGIMAAGSGDTASKYVARRETPLYIPENCTQCMECIAVCPDTALPNCSQDLETVLRTAVTNYVSDAGERQKMYRSLPEIEKRTREMMRDAVAKNAKTPLQDIIRDVTNVVDGFSPEAKSEFFAVLDKVPLAFQKTNAIFATPEKKTPGAGGVFSIFVSDLCKGCAACVTACGEHQALRMVQETEEVNAEHETGTAFLDLLPDTSQKYLGLYSDTRPQDSKTATLRNMLMVRRNYDALVSGDGACAGCGEKSILKAITSVTEAYMRPVFHAKADRFRAKADELDREGVAKLAALKERSPEEYALFRQAVAHLLMGLGGEDEKDTQGAHGGARSHLGQGSRQRDNRRHAAGSVQSQEPAGHRWPARQRHVGDGHGGPHGLQHRVRLDAVEQPASVSVDELALPGRHHRRLAPGRKLHRRPRSPLGYSGAADRCADASRRERDQRTRVLRVRALQRRRHDRSGNPRAAEGVGRRRRWRYGRHRISEHVEGHPPESAEREGAHAGHAGVFEYRRPEFGLHADAGRQRHERLRNGDPGQEHREEDRGRDVPRRPWLAVYRPGVDRQRAEALQGDSRRPRVPWHGVLSVLHDLPAGTWRRRRHGADSGTACSRLARCAGVRVQPENGRNVPGSARREGQSFHGDRTGTRRSSRRPTSRTVIPWPTGVPPRRDSAIT